MSYDEMECDLRCKTLVHLKALEVVAHLGTFALNNSLVLKASTPT